MVELLFLLYKTRSCAKSRKENVKTTKYKEPHYFQTKTETVQWILKERGFKKEQEEGEASKKA